MTERYRVDRSIGGGYTVRQTDFIDDMVFGVAGVAGKLIGASVDGLAALAQNSRDRKMSDAIDEMISTADSGNFERLRRFAAAFCEQYPQQPHGHVFANVALTGLGRYDEALTAINKAVQLGLEPLEATRFRIETYQKKGDLGNFLKECSTLIQSSQTRRDGYIGRAFALLQIRDLDLALSDVNRAIELCPDRSGYFLRGHIYRARQQPEQALADYTRADRLYPNWADLLEQRAEVYDLLEKTAQADADRAQVAQLRERNRDPSEAEAVKEARHFLNELRSNGVKIKVAPNGSDLEYDAYGLRPKEIVKLQRLKLEIVQILQGAA